MKYFLIILLILSCSLQIPVKGFAQSDIIIGARPQGLGGSFIAVSGDPYSVFYNPAGVSNIHYLSIPLFWARPTSGLTNGGSTISYAGVFLPSKRFGTSGLNFLQRGTDNGNITLLTENLLSFSWGRSLHERISFGMNYDYYFHQWNAVAIGDNPYLRGKTDVEGFGIDVGIHARLMKSFQSGLTIENLLRPDIGLVEKIRLPQKLIIGGLYQLEEAGSISLMADWGWEFNESQQVWHLGAEKWFEESIALRGGIEDGRGYSRLSVGAGYKFLTDNFRFCIDYAYSHTTGDLGWQPNPHVFSLTMDFVKPTLQISEKVKPSSLEVIEGVKPSLNQLIEETKGFVDNLPPKLELKAYPKFVRFDGDNVADTLFVKLNAEDLALPEQLSSGVENWQLIFRKDDKEKTKPVLNLRDVGKPPQLLKWTGMDSINQVVPNGWYRIILSVSDSSGNRSVKRNVRFKVISKKNDLTPPKIEFAASDTIVTPDGDRKGDMIRFKIRVQDAESAITQWGLQIYRVSNDSGRQVVKTFSKNKKQKNLPRYLTWYGDNNRWQRLSNGIYYAQFFAENEVGRRSETAPLYLKVQANEELIRTKQREEEKKKKAIEEKLGAVEINNAPEEPKKKKVKPQKYSPNFIEVKVFLISGEKIIRVPSFYFTFSDELLEKTSRDALLMLNAQLQNFPERQAILQNYAANKQIAQKRGENIKRYLVENLGVDENRILIEGYKTTKGAEEIRIKTK